MKFSSSKVVPLVSPPPTPPTNPSHPPLPAPALPVNKVDRGLKLTVNTKALFKNPFKIKNYL